jgi:hypothetical protein
MQTTHFPALRVHCNDHLISATFCKSASLTLYSCSDRSGSETTADDKSEPRNCGISRAAAAIKSTVPPANPEVLTRKSRPGHSAGNSPAQFSTRHFPYLIFQSAHRLMRSASFVPGYPSAARSVSDRPWGFVVEATPGIRRLPSR